LPGTLTLYEADLLKEGSFDEVVKGSDFVFHAASPFFNSPEDPQKELVDPAVKGTKNVLSSVAKHKDTVKRTVVTSSFAAIVNPKGGPSTGKELYDEESWNTESTLEDGPYRLSKVEAEKAAWELSKEHGFTLLTVNPTFVIGPVISNRVDATSIQTVQAIIEGKTPSIIPWVVDVRDIAKAHIGAIEVPSAKGRYLVSQSHTHSKKFFTDTLKKRFPEYKIQDGEDEPRKQLIDNSKVQKELGIKLIDPAESIIDMAVTLIQRGIAKPQLA
jgi:nucleoside-diphosphate-sugar epimerase